METHFTGSRKSGKWKQPKRLMLTIASSVVVTFGLIALIQNVRAGWQDPTCDPAADPGAAGCNVAAPLNVSDVTQSKTGALTIGGLLTGAGGLTVPEGKSVDLPTGSIDTLEIKDGDVNEEDLNQITATPGGEGVGNGLDGSEIEDIYLLNSSDSMSGSLAIGGTLGVTGVATFATDVAINGNLDVDGNLNAGGIIAADGSPEASYFQGKGFELTEVKSLDNAAGSTSIGELQTVALFGRIARNPSGIAFPLPLAPYQIPGNGKTVIPVHIQALKCVNCTDPNLDEEFKRYDPGIEANLEYERCDSANRFTNKINIRGDAFQDAMYAIIFTYYAMDTADPCDPFLIDFSF